MGYAGRHEDPLHLMIASGVNAAVTLSAKHFPGATEELLLELQMWGDMVDATVTFLDEASGERVSKAWNQLDPETQDRLKGAGEILAIALPAASVKTLRVLRPARSLPDVPRPGTLTKISDDVWESAGGLRYGPDPKFGNRVQHVIRHATDDIAQQGTHGVFDAGRTATLGVIDDAWRLAQKGGSAVSVEVQEIRTVYTVNMRKRIGYIGGQAGAASGNTGTSYVQLVMEGTNVITAYPIPTP